MDSRKQSTSYDVYQDTVDILKLIKPTPSSIGGKNGIERVELLKTYEELKHIVETSAQDDPNILNRLSQFLANRWERIQNTDLSYCFNPHSPMNQVCFKLAEKLSPNMQQPAVKLLMPNLDLTAPQLSGQDPYDLKPWQFILSDEVDKEGKTQPPHIIMVQDCLSFTKETGQFRDTSLKNGQVELLSSDEKERMIHHSPQAEVFYQAIMKRKNFVDTDHSMLGYLNRLIEKLRGGGAHGGHGGTESIAGADANIGILEFSEFLNKLEPDERNKLFHFSAHQFQNTNIGIIWNRLAHPTYRPTGNQDTPYCVEVNASELSTIISEHQEELENWIPKFAQQQHLLNRQQLEQEITEAERQLEQVMLRGVHYDPNISYGQAGNDRLLKQLMENEGKNSIAMAELIKRYPALGISLKIASYSLSGINNQTLQKITYKIPALEQGIETTTQIRNLLVQLSSEDKIEFFTRLPTSLLIKHFHSIEMIAMFILGNQADQKLNVQEKSMIINHLASQFNRNAFSPSTTRSIVDFLQDCGFNKNKLKDIHLNELFTLFSKANLNDLREFLIFIEDKDKQCQLLKQIDITRLKTMLQTASLEEIKKFNDILPHDQASYTSIGSVLMEVGYTSLSVRLNMIKGNSDVMAAALELGKLIEGTIKDDVSVMTKKKFNKELQDIYDQYQKVRGFFLPCILNPALYVDPSDEKFKFFISDPDEDDAYSLYNTFIRNTHPAMSGSDTFFLQFEYTPSRSPIKAKWENISNWRERAGWEIGWFTRPPVNLIMLDINLWKDNDINRAQQVYEQTRHLVNFIPEDQRPIILVVGKSMGSCPLRDIEGKNEERAQQFAEEHQFPYFKINNNDRENVCNFMCKAVQMVFEKKHPDLIPAFPSSLALSEQTSTLDRFLGLFRSYPSVSSTTNPTSTPNNRRT